MQARGFSFNISLSFNCYKYTTFFWNKQIFFNYLQYFFLDPPDLQIFVSLQLKKTNDSKIWQHLEEKEKLPNVKK